MAADAAGSAIVEVLTIEIGSAPAVPGVSVIEPAVDDERSLRERTVKVLSASAVVRLAS
jgi:hypothetical protein